MRTIIFGDIHGCWSEWQALLDKIGPTSSDRLVSVGDLICKGPDSGKTLELARRMKNLTCVLGNHELRFLRYWNEEGERPKHLTDTDERTFRELGRRYDDHMRYIASWPHYLDLPEALVVHGGLRPGVALGRQDIEDLTGLRTVGKPPQPWFETYKGPKLAVFGHWVVREPIYSEHAIGLDTGCVYGGKLSAFILPERRVVQVKARRTYAVRKNQWGW